MSEAMQQSDSGQGNNQGAPAVPLPPMQDSSATEPLVMRGGNGINFEEFEQIEALNAAAKAKSEKSGKTQSPIDKQLIGDKLEDAGDKKLKVEDDKPAEDKVLDPKELAKAELKKKEAADQAAKATAAVSKLIKAKHGDKTMDLASDILIPVKVDGKIEEVSLQDAINGYAGEKTIKQRFSQLDVERKSFYNERDTLNQRVNSLYETAVKEGNPKDAILALAEAMGSPDPLKVWNDLQLQVAKVLEEYGKLSPEEAKAKQAEQERDYYKRKVDKGQADRAFEAEKTELQTRIQTVQQKLKIEDKDFVEAYDLLKSEVARGTITQDYLNPEFVGDFITHRKQASGVSSLVSELFADNPSRGEAVSKHLLGVWAQNPKFTLEDIKDIAGEVFVPKKTGLARKIEKQKAETPAKPQESGSYGWDDL